MKLLLLLLLLFVCRVCLIKAYTWRDEVEYGETFRFTISRSATLVEFNPRDSWSSSVIWNQNDPKVMDKTKYKVVDERFFEIIRVTHQDSGIYTVLDGRRRLRTQEITVYTPVREYNLKTEDRLHFSANVEKQSCNIFFFPVGSKYDIRIVENGRQIYDIDGISCVDFYFSEPCQLSNNNLQSSCNGHFEVRDEHGDVALSVLVEIENFYPVYFAIGGIILAIVLIACCARRFCCGRNSSSKKPAAVSEPVVTYEYEQEPAGPRPNQLNTPSRTRYPAESSRSTTGPLIHDPPTVNVPAGYSSILTRAQEPDGAVEPLCSGPEPRFELKGLNFNFGSPLNSDSTDCHVYTSDKLNFL